MSLFYFITLFLGVILLPFNSIAQSYLVGQEARCPAGYLYGKRDTSRFICLNYSSPYGLVSLKSVALEYQHPLERGLAIAKVHTLGITGYYQFRLAAGYGITFDKRVKAELLLQALILQYQHLGSKRIYPGSSIALSYNQKGRFFASLEINDWPGFLLSEKYHPIKPGIRTNAEYITYSSISLVGGITCEKGLSPLFTAGLMINTGKNYTLGAGAHSGPPGFWIAFFMSKKNLDLLFSLSTSGVFGYEPSSMFKYHFQ